MGTKHIIALTGHYSNAVRSKHIKRDYAWAIKRTQTPFILTSYVLYMQSSSDPRCIFGGGTKGLELLYSTITYHLLSVRFAKSLYVFFRLNAIVAS